MFFIKLLIIFSIALIISGLFYVFFRDKMSGENFLVLVLVLFLSMWAANLWIHPVGPELLGVRWVPLLFTGLFIALILAISIPLINVSGDKPKIPKSLSLLKQKRLINEYRKEKISLFLFFGSFFWILLTVLIIAIFTGYYLNS